ncbi:predicted protein, partial [Naegleria gruberi]
SKSKDEAGGPKHAQFYSAGTYEEEAESAAVQTPVAASSETTEATPTLTKQEKAQKKATKEHTLGLITFKIIEFLQEDTSKKYTFQQILEAIDHSSCTNEVDEEEEKEKTGVKFEDSLAAHLDDRIKKAIYLKLMQNHKVDYQGPTTKNIDENATFCFKAIHQSIKEKKHVLELLQNPEFVISGIPVSELAESYKGVLNDIEELKKEKAVISIPNQDKKCDILYFNDVSVDMPIVDVKLRDLWRGTRERRIPASDLPSLLQKVGLPAIQTVEWPEDEHRKKKEAEREENAKNTKTKRTRKMNVKKMTNKHLAEEFVAHQK